MSCVRILLRAPSCVFEQKQCWSIPRKQWVHPDLPEKFLTRTLEPRYEQTYIQFKWIFKFSISEISYKIDQSSCPAHLFHERYSLLFLSVSLFVHLFELMLCVPVNSNGHVAKLPPFNGNFTQH